MAHGGEDHLVHIKARLFGVGLVEAGGGGGHVKELQHGAALGAGVAAVPAADIVRGDAPLLVRRARQRYHRILAGDIVLHLHRIAHGVDIRVGGLHPLVHNDAALEPQLQPGLGGQAAVGADAYGQHHHVGMEGSRVLQQHVHAPVLLLKALHGEAQSQLHPVAAHLVVDIGGHVGVEGVHQLFGPLDNGNIQAQLPQVLRQLQAYEAAPRQHGGFGLLLHHVIPYLKAILHGAQGEELVYPRSGELWLGGLCSGGEDELVVVLLKLLPCLQVPHGDGLFLRVDGSYLVVHPHVNSEPGIKALWSLEGQVLRVLYSASDVVGQAAVCIGDIARTLKDHYLRLLVQTAKPGRRRGSPRHAAHNDNFHLVFHLSFISGYAADVLHIVIAYAPEHGRRLGAAGPAETVDVHRAVLAHAYAFAAGKGGQGQIHAAGYMSPGVLLRSPHVCQQRPRGVSEFLNFGVYIRSLEYVQYAHCSFPFSSAAVPALRQPSCFMLSL